MGTLSEEIYWMPARAYWYDEQNKRLIILEFSGKWTAKEYAMAMNESVSMLESVHAPVAIILNFLSNKKQAFSREVIDECLKAVKRWDASENYSKIWVSISTGDWERLLVWTLSRIYNPTGLAVAASLDEACSIAYGKLEQIERG
jgi:hypothetical protein